LGTLALTMSMTDAGRDAAPIAEEAVRAIRAIGDPSQIAVALFVLATVLPQGAPSHARRRAIADELFALGTRGDDNNPVFGGVRLSMVAETEAADREAIERNFSRIEVEFPGTAIAWIPAGMRAMWRAMLALAEGRFDDCDALTDEILAASGAEANLTASARALKLFLAHELGRSGTLLPLMRHVVRRGRPLVSVRANHALVALDASEPDEAQAVLGELLRDGVDALPSDVSWSGAVAVLAEVARAVGTADQQRQLVDALRPLTGLLIVNSWGVICHGAADRYLGGLLVERGALDEGIAAIEAGLALEERLQARALSTRSLLWLAEARARRAGPEDREVALALATRARDHATVLGMAPVASGAMALMAALSHPTKAAGAVSSPARPSPRRAR